MLRCATHSLTLNVGISWKLFWWWRALACFERSYRSEWRSGFQCFTVRSPGSYHPYLILIDYYIFLTYPSCVCFIGILSFQSYLFSHWPTLSWLGRFLNRHRSLTCSSHFFRVVQSVHDPFLHWENLVLSHRLLTIMCLAFLFDCLMSNFHLCVKYGIFFVNCILVVAVFLSVVSEFVDSLVKSFF